VARRAYGEGRYPSRLSRPHSQAISISTSFAPQLLRPPSLPLCGSLTIDLFTRAQRLIHHSQMPLWELTPFCILLTARLNLLAAKHLVKISADGSVVTSWLVIAVYHYWCDGSSTGCGVAWKPKAAAHRIWQ